MRSQQGFQIIVQIIIMPLIFLSGVFFPVNNVPPWLEVISKINPLTYGVDAIRQLFLGGVIGQEGYTIGVTSLTAYTYAPHHAKLVYKREDFDYLTLVALNSSGFISKSDKPWNTLKEAFDWHKKNDKAMVAMFHGADDRDAITRIAKKEGVKLSLIPSKGGPSVIKAVTGGHADVGYVGAILYKHVEAGSIKLIAAALGERLPPIPDVPTLREQGYDEQVEMIVALVAPKGMKKEVKAKLLAAADQLANDKETQDFITSNLLMRPVKWGEAHADQTAKNLYKTFGEQAKMK